jgi:UDP-3-O-[3-hydroxymyristoyl] N-acetylglucosamine deacetylase
VRRIVREFRLEGTGLHAGERGAACVRPAAPGAGLQVGRDGSFVSLRPALARAGTSRCTVLELAGGPVSTVEHLLAALAGCGVRDALLEFTGPEVPILDGSALPWAEAITAQTEVVADEAGPPAALVHGLRFRHGSASYEVEPATRTQLEVGIADPHPQIGAQRRSWDGSEETFVREIAPARSYARLEDLAAIFAAGQARGGSLDCAVVFGPDGPLGGSLRFPDEPVRHKLLDLLGDLALCGRLPAVRVRAAAPFHAANRELAVELARLAGC